MWTMAYRDEATVMAPIEERLRWLSFWGLALGGGFILLGYYIASQKIIAPLGSLRQAAHAISQTVESAEENQSAHSKFPASRESNTLLQAVKAIRTGDEIEDLANEFRFMGQRILSYQEKLETKIAEKTEEIQRDLDFARQFQVNLMPQRYPEVPPRSKHPALGLNFHHVYRPASTVGGDFFNVLKLDDTKAGIFIADVMGHGARSALVTAIIATLLQEIEKSTVNPAEALELLNHHFYKVVHTTGDVLFVSAFYLILDLEAMTATYASAGHPSPLLLEQETGNVVELTPHLHNNPALGLFEHRTYELFQRPIKNRDVFLLFTDGLVEVMNSHDEEFGSQRLKKLIEANQREDLTHLADRMVDAAIAFAGNEGPSDDICLVGVEVGSMNAIH
jgi:serine phosphatase RsbU (regulator of sigma subunit)